MSFFSIVQYTGDGAQGLFSIPFPYLDREHIQVRVADVLKTVGVDYSFISDSQIAFVTPPAYGTRVDIRRSTSRSVRLVDYENGSKLTEALLDRDSLQGFYLAQEAYDSSIQLQPAGYWDVQNRRLINVAAGTESTDAVTKAQLDAIAAAAGNVPTPGDPSDDGKVLSAAGGTFSWTRQAVTNLLDFAVGDGVTNDATNIQTSINTSGVSVIDGHGATYKVNAQLTLKSNLELRNLTLDFSGLGTGTPGLYASGSTGSNISLTGDCTAGSLSFTVTSAAGISKGDYLWLRSAGYYETNTNTTHAEIVRVANVSGNTITLFDAVHASYTLADNAYINRLTLVENITLRNVKIIGGGNATQAGGKDQYGARFIACRKVRVIDSDIDLMDYAGVEFAICYDVAVFGGEMSRAHDSTDGASYGVMFTQGTQHGKVIGTTFEDQRHGVTTGGTSGVNRYITAGFCTMQGQRAGGLDTHAGTELVNFIGNTVSCAVGALGSGTQNGIQHLGGSATIQGNTVRGAYESGIAVQVFAKTNAEVSITGNKVKRTDGTGAANIGILFENRSTATAGPVDISNNLLSADLNTGIYVDAETGSISYLTINSNGIKQAASRGIYVVTQGSNVVNFFAITGNNTRVNGGGFENIFLSAASAGNISYGTVTGNTCFAGTYGIRGVNTDRVASAANAAVGWGTAAVSIAGANSVNGGGNVTA